MRRTFAITAGLVILVAGTPAGAYVPEKTPRRAAEAAARVAASRPAARPGVAGLMVLRGGRAVAGINADRPMAPASLIKMATTTAAITRLGPRFRFRTSVVADAAGATVGTLYLVGGGDPTLATEAYRRRRFLPKPT